MRQKGCPRPNPGKEVVRKGRRSPCKGNLTRASLRGGKYGRKLGEVGRGELFLGQGPKGVGWQAKPSQ